MASHKTHLNGVSSATVTQDGLVEVLALLTQAAEKLAGLATVGASHPVVATVRNAYAAVKQLWLEVAKPNEQEGKAAAGAQQQPPATQAKPAEAGDTAALLREYEQLGGNAGLAKRWGLDALRRNVEKLRGKKQNGTTPTSCFPAQAPAAEHPPRPTVTLVVDADKADVLKQLAALSKEQLQELARFIPAL